jgi:hypothetical protein
MKLGSSIRFVALSVLVLSASLVPAATPSIEVGSRAPVLELMGDDGTRLSLAASHGPKILIFYRGLW